MTTSRISYRVVARSVAAAGAVLIATGLVGNRNTQVATAAIPSSRATSPIAFTDVTVIPVDRERLIPHQDVVVSDGRIASISPTGGSLPEGVIRIDGRGKFLMPGLAEMHAHVLGPQAQNSEELNRDIMFLYVANGITTIRAMLGAPNQLVLRDQIARGEVLGPTMFVAAPSLNGQTAPDAQTAERLVRAHKNAGYDLLKIHPGLNLAAYDAIVRTARETGITWGGHVSADIGVEHILDTRQSTVDHLDGYIEAAASRDGNMTEMWRSVTDTRLRELARKTKQAGTWNVPTMFLWESFYLPGSPEDWSTRDEMKYVPKQWVSNWVNQKRQRIAGDAQNGVAPADAALHIALRRKMLKALADEGAPLLMGTDSPQMFNVPGFALHRELQVAVEAGLTPYQVIESGSKNVGLYAARDLRKDGKFGTVAVGNRADLVLLNANPLQSLSNLSNRAGVMVKGRWISKAEIERGLDSLAGKFSK